MKKNTFHTGGHKPSILDFTHAQDGVVEALKGVILAMSGTMSTTKVVLAGCSSTSASGVYTIGEGFVYINGEIYYHPVQVIGTPSAGNQIQLGIVESFDSNDPIPYATGGNKNVHSIKNVSFYWANTPNSGDFSLSAFQYSYELLRTNIGFNGADYLPNNSSANNFIAFDPANGLNYGSGWSNNSSTYKAAYKIDQFGKVTLRGKVICGASPAGTIITLPIPVTDTKDFPVKYELSSGGYGLNYLRVSSNGSGGMNLECSAAAPPFANGSIVDLNSISFYP